jgi:hypothetical protein
MSDEEAMKQRHIFPWVVVIALMMTVASAVVSLAGS